MDAHRSDGEKGTGMMAIFGLVPRRFRNPDPVYQNPTGGLAKVGIRTFAVSLLLVGTTTVFALSARPGAQENAPFGPQELHPTTVNDPLASLTPKQKQSLMKSNFEKLKREADDLAGLAKSLQEEIGKSNQNVMSLKVVEKAEKIEKLAKKIKSAAKGE